MSAIIKKHRLIYLHIPRTGGSWAYKAFNISNVRASLDIQKLYYPDTNKKLRKGLKSLEKHCLLQHYSKKSSAEWDFVISFVRHPIQYYESIWSHFYDKIKKEWGYKKFSRRIKGCSWHPYIIPFSYWNEDFNIWMKDMLKYHPGWVSHLFEMYVGPEDVEFCDYIGRTERLIEDFSSIMSDFGINADKVSQVGRINVSNPDIVWDESLLQDVIAAEHMAINRFYGDNYNKIRYKIENK